MRYLLIGFILVTVVVGSGFYFFKKNVETPDPNIVQVTDQTPSDVSLVGADEDEHGCKISAGYSWCEVKNKCLRTWEEACDTGTEVAMAVQEAIAQKFEKPKNTVIISVDRDTGEFAKGGVRFTDDIGGAIWFAANVDGVWKLVADGQGPMACVAANEYSMPTDFVPECVDGDGELVVR